MVLGQRPRSWGTTRSGEIWLPGGTPFREETLSAQTLQRGLAPWSPVRDSSPCCLSLTFKDSYGTQGHQACGFLRFWRAIFSLSHWRVAVLMRNRPSYHHIPHQTARSTHACTHTHTPRQANQNQKAVRPTPSCHREWDSIHTEGRGGGWPGSPSSSQDIHQCQSSALSC